MDQIMPLFNAAWPFLLMIGIFYFLLYRPQKKEKAERKQFLEQLSKNSKVITVGGLYGTVKAIKGEIVVLQIAPKTEIRVAKAAVHKFQYEEEEEEVAKEVTAAQDDEATHDK